MDNSTTKAMPATHQSVAFLLFSWLPMVGTVALTVHYFLVYAQTGIDPETSQLFRATAMGHYGLLLTALYGMLFTPILIFFWVLSVVSGKIRNVKLGLFNTIIFLVSAAANILIFLTTAYAGWLME